MTQLTRHDSVLPLTAPAPGPLPAASPAPISLRQRIADLATLAKVRITVMVVLTAWLGFAIGEAAAAKAGLALFTTPAARLAALLAAMVGSALSCMGASALNQVYERDTDALMHRTRNRPMPAGRLGVVPGNLFGAALCVLGVAVLALFTTPLAAALSAFTILSYVMVYTPLKRLSHTSTVVGAAPGALPPIIGFAAAAGTLSIEAAAVFSIMFIWQLPHFLAIAWMYREDYARAGFPMLPVIDPTGKATFRQMLLTCLILVPVGVMPTLVGMTGIAYFVVALIAGLAFMACGIRVALRQDNASARLMFFASLIYLPVVLVMMVVDSR